VIWKGGPIRYFLKRHNPCGPEGRDAKHEKLAPDIFLEASPRIGVDPKFCRPYEDTDLGMRAIRDAGMEAVDVREFIQKR